MNNKEFISNLIYFLNIMLKAVGLAPFSYLKSKRMFVSCKLSTIMSYVVGAIILIASVPIESFAALHFAPYRDNTVSYVIGYLHIFFTLVKIWLNQILTISYRKEIIRHFNQAFKINDALKHFSKQDLLDDKMIHKIKFRICLFLLQSAVIIFGVNAYISRSFIQSSTTVRIFICFSYINSVFVTTIYLGCSLMLCDRYCRVLYKRIEDLIEDVKRKRIGMPQPNQYYYKLKLHEAFDQISDVYDQVIMFVDTSHTLFASHVVICTCSTFLVSLHGTFTFYCSVRNEDFIRINTILLDLLITICYVIFKFIEFICVMSLSLTVKKKIEELRYLLHHKVSIIDVDVVLINMINLLAIQMQQTQPHYKFCGLFELDKKFMFSLLVTIVSYLIILIQFDISAASINSS